MTKHLIVFKYFRFYTTMPFSNVSAWESIFKRFSQDKNNIYVYGRLKLREKYTFSNVSGLVY